MSDIKSHKSSVSQLIFPIRSAASIAAFDISSFNESSKTAFSNLTDLSVNSPITF